MIWNLDPLNTRYKACYGSLQWKTNITYDNSINFLDTVYICMYVAYKWNK